MTLTLKVTSWFVYLQAFDVHALHFGQEGEREKAYVPFYLKSSSFRRSPPSRFFIPSHYPELLSKESEEVTTFTCSMVWPH